ncbi:DUF1217 domain-containing protein [Allorhizobium taibaishanense]|uniref:Flagellar protein n=1 Tax=Allorhizobium taibaishanense TaxID=887144 RepID=A0A1Q9AAU9_9HYPH|nr:DUF1217 domain-containing protein [Allorhizobium taibaishanense]MBB4006982.1 hypothetical protein [Allorhizobium taibaishanense]OLP51952.1 hypothetical protein BJF91_22960 [Allorhizobium taibaishanense]
MVSTYIGYDLVNRDMKTSLKRVAQEPEVARELKYYQDNIGKVKTVDDFMKDDRLYTYAMKAHGLEDMTYAKAFMKKVLESDLNDENSYANKLADDRYRNFARSFNFSSETADMQTEKQEDDVIGLYKQSLVTEGDDAKAEVQYYDTAIDGVKNVDDLLKNSRLTKFVLNSYGLDTKYYSTDHLKKILTSDLSDPTSYANTLTTNKSDYLKIANAFSFDTDGSLKNATAQTADQKTAMEDLYLEEVPSTETAFRAERETTNYRTKIAAVTKVSDITGDSRLFDYVKTALGMDKNMLKSTFENIVTSDLSDPTSYANTQGKVKGDYAKIAAMFNFDTSGNTTAGDAQSAAQLSQTTTGYNTNYDDADQASLDSLTTYYTTQMKSFTKVDDLLNNSRVYDMLMKAYGIGEDEFSKANLKKVLTSDMTDPKSYANKTNDKRLISLASAFNFKSDGTPDVPLLAQSERTITETAKDYIVQKTRFLSGKAQTDAKTAAQTDAKYYQDNIVKVTSVTDLLKDRKLVDFALTANGLDATKVTDDMLKQLFSSDLTDPKSFANAQSDERYAQFVASFNFDTSGKLDKNYAKGVQNRGEVQSTENLYLHQSLETEQGQSDQGVRLALYWQRQAPTITSAYDILADSALLEVFRTAYSLPSDMSNMDIDQQKKVIEKKMDLNDLKDPNKEKKFLQRFTAMYDLQNDNGSSANAALTILGGGSSSGGISASLLESLNSR